PGSGDAEAGAHAVTTAGPAGVDQVDLAAEGIDALDQQFGVNTSRTRAERCAEAGGEGRLDAAARTHLGGTDQRGVTGQEVVDRLYVLQEADVAMSAVQLARQEAADVPPSAQVRIDTLLGMLQRTGGTGRRGQAHTGVIGLAGLRIDDDLLQHGAELDGI